MRTIFLSLLLFTFLLSFSISHRHFLSRLPNSLKVNGPCEVSSSYVNGSFCYCEAFGHTDCTYTPSKRNIFGQAFGKKKIWDYDLCIADSDEDGKSNGDELGDGCCEWNVGDTPSRTYDITNPGSKTSTTRTPSCILSGAPSAPTTIFVISATKSQLRLAWNNDTKHCVCSYTLEVQSGGKTKAYKHIKPNDIPFTVCDLVGDRVQVSVRAVNLAGESVPVITQIPLSAVSVADDTRKCSQTSVPAHLIGEVKAKEPSFTISLALMISIFCGLSVVGILCKWYESSDTNKLRRYLHHQRLLPPSRNPLIYNIFESFFSLSYAQLMLVISILLASILFFVYQFQRYNSMLYLYVQHSELSRAIGELSHFFLALILLPVTKYSIWVVVFGISYERAIKFHRWIGRIYFFLISLHGIGMAYSYWTTSPFLLDYIFRWSQVQNSSHNFPAIVGWMLFFFMFITSIELVRRNFYRLFFFSHFLFVPAILCVLLHSKAAVYYLLPGLVMYIFDISALFLDACVVRKSSVMSAVTSFDDREDESGNSFVELKILKERFTFQPGQYVYLMIPAISLVPHPFTICTHHHTANLERGGGGGGGHQLLSDHGSDEVGHLVERADESLPPKGKGPFGWTNEKACAFGICLKVSGRGGFTDKLASYVSNGIEPGLSNLTTLVWGPFGSPTVDIYSYKWVLFIAGGIGITPIVPMWQKLRRDNGVQRFLQNKVVLCWTFRNPHLIEHFKDSLEISSLSHHFANSKSSSSSNNKTSSSSSSSSSSQSDSNQGSSSFNSSSSLSSPRLSSSGTKDAKKKIKEEGIFDVKLYCTGRSLSLEDELMGFNGSDSRSHEMSFGRPDIDMLIFDFSAQVDSNVAVVVCGPPSLANDVIRVCTRANQLSSYVQFHVHQETFLI